MRRKTMDFKILIVFLIFAVISGIGGKNYLYSQYESFNYNGRTRTYLIHLPPDYHQNDSTYALILAFHGGLGDAFNLENQSQLSQKADTARNKFIVVYPEGVKNLLGKRTWNAGGCCGYARDHDIDDVGFVSVLIDSLVKNYRIDRRKIYATGMSNGGMLCYRLAAELSEKIAAIAPVAATMVLSEVIAPKRAVPIIHFHSFLDENIPYFGGIGSGVSKHYNPPVDSVLSAWAQQNGCGVLDDTLYHQSDEYLLREWRDCKDNTKILCYVTYDGGHSWPGGKKGFLFGDPPSKKINATDLMWEFFQNYQIQSPTDVWERRKEVLSSDFSLQVYPNPFNNFTNISFNLPALSAVKVGIFNLRGKIIKELEIKPNNRGRYSFLLNANGLASGVYFLQLKTSSDNLVKKLILLE